jgi:peptidyl-prolyl cis-trans isomerase B (cyclophilin B)
VTHGGYGGGQPDPFGPDPFGGPPSTQGYTPPLTQGFSPPTGSVFPPPSGTPSGEVNTFATLSIVFAFVFAPAGAALAHVALSQIKQRGQTSRASCLVPGSHAYRLFLATALTAEALAR